MSKSVSDLRSIAASGGGMILDAGHFSISDLKSIAASASTKKAQITLRGMGHKSVSDLKSIAASGDGCVVFDFTS